MSERLIVAAQPDRLGVGCGSVLMGAAALVPVIVWLIPLWFSGPVALVGLLCLAGVPHWGRRPARSGHPVGWADLGGGLDHLEPIRPGSLA